MSNFVTNTTQLQNAGWTMNLNKHYPITKCWMDGGESTKSQQSSLRLVMPWTNFQWHFKLWSSLSPNWDECWNWETFVFNYKFRATTRKKERKHKCAFVLFSGHIWTKFTSDTSCLYGCGRGEKGKEKKTHNTKKDRRVPSLPQCCLLIHFPRHKGIDNLLCSQICNLREVCSRILF